MPSHRPSRETRKNAAPPRTSSALAFLLFLLLTSPCPASAAEAAKRPPAKEKPQLTPSREISFDYSMRADGRNEFLVLGEAPMKNYKTLLLADPPRLVLDIPGVALPGNTAELPVNTPELSRIRIARHPDKVRFVFDLPEGKDIRNKVIARDKGLKVLLSLAPDQAPPRNAATAEARNSSEKTPSPPAGRQPQCLAASELEEIFGSQRVSVVFQKTPIREFAQYLSEKSGRRIEVSPELAVSVSLRLTEVPLHALVQAAAATIGFALRQEGERIVLYPAEPQPPAAGQKKGDAS